MSPHRFHLYRARAAAPSSSRAGLAVAAALLISIQLGAPTSAANAQPAPPPPTSPLAAAPGPAPGEDPHRDGADEHADARAAAAKNRINLRIGGASTDTIGRPTICLEVRAIAGLSLEGCGAGGGFLHHQEGAEVAHFRAKWLIHRRVFRGGQLRLHGGVGFAELQLADDAPGFRFGSPDGAKIETAGPEAALSIAWLRPLGDSGWELIMNMSGGMAWMPHADELVDPHSERQPFAAFEIGAGW